MTFVKTTAAAALLASSLALGGCMDDGYGYGGVNVGYGPPGYYDYGDYGYAPYGWYDGYYYPGNGYWLYDRGGSRHRWNDGHRRYWEQRRAHSRDWRGPSNRPWQPGIRDDDHGQPDSVGSRPERNRERPWRNGRGDTGASQAAPQVEQPRQPQGEGMTAPGTGNSRGDWKGRERRPRRER